MKAAIDYVLSWEDPTLSGVITQTADGKRTRFGIDEHYHPELAASLFYSSLGKSAALIIARNVYTKAYCDPLCIADMVNQEIANKVLSLGVNVGVTTASKMLQDALAVPGDGRIGPRTLYALEQADPARVLSDLRTEAEYHYEKVIAANPQDEVFRAGWLRRAEA